MHALYNHCIRHMESSLVQLNFFGHADLSNKNITSDMLKDLHFPPKTQSIDLSRNKLTTLEGVRFPKELEDLDLSHNQITTLEGVTLPFTIIKLNLTNNPNLTLKGVNDFHQLGWKQYRPYRGPVHPMNQLVLTRTKVTLKDDLCYMKNIPIDFKVMLNEGVFKNNQIEEACHTIISKSAPGSFGSQVMKLKGGKKRHQTKRRQAKRQQTRRQAKRQSKLKK